MISPSSAVADYGNSFIKDVATGAKVAVLGIVGSVSIPAAGMFGFFSTIGFTEFIMSYIAPKVAGKFTMDSTLCLMVGGSCGLLAIACGAVAYYAFKEIHNTYKNYSL